MLYGGSIRANPAACSCKERERCTREESARDLAQVGLGGSARLRGPWGAPVNFFWLFRPQNDVVFGGLTTLFFFDQDSLLEKTAHAVKSWKAGQWRIVTVERLCPMWKFFVFILCVWIMFINIWCFSLSRSQTPSIPLPLVKIVHFLVHLYSIFISRKKWKQR